MRILSDVEVRHVREWLRQTPKRTHPGAWKSRYLAVQTFFNYGVFIGILDPRENPLATSPRGATLTNKPMLTELDFHRLLMVIPATHTGIQDKLVCHLLWHGWTLRNINNLRVSDVMYFPAKAKEIAEGMLTHRRHTHDAHLWLDAFGNPRTLHGQKLNKRLQKNAERAELPNSSRLSASLLYQSGTYHRILSCEEEN